ncbi:MAG: transposase [Lancefieldella sp.]
MESGLKEIIGISLADTETKESWTSFIKSLAARGLCDVKMFTSDTHDAIASALQEVFPEVA